MNEKLEKKFADCRREFPHTENTVYFNSASYGPFSITVKKAIEDNINLRLAADIDDTLYAFTVAEELRSDYAALVGADKQDIGLGLNTSFGLNVMAFGLPLPRGSEILVSDIEFPAIIYTWRAAAERFGYELKFVPAKDMSFDIETFKKAITGKTKVLAVSYVQFFNGYKNDLATLSQICRENDILLVVDGIQGMGTEPVDVRQLGLDVFTSGCQKWMLAPQGCGFFYLDPELRRKIQPPFMSWLGVDWQMNFTSLFKFDNPCFDSTRKFELGYYVVLNLAGMKAAVRYFQHLGIENIQRHNHRLIDRLAEYIKSNRRYKITSSMTPLHRSSIFTFTCDNYKELHQEIVKRKIILALREGSLRVSVHFFNNDDDIDKLLEVLDDFSKR
ncbi:MAG: aminotransferase class V-fold PLP-dependent enzyme [candidate division Zixibacteria bacterium]|nr:aminotransferase class V-fold PLP-dependent enzyme [candidate division Zixibacteria bacterium]MDD5426813.1 aminotransferase class V-fold PLP-dependent enzyme [candidate division Zixibacteria bacterium]